MTAKACCKLVPVVMVCRRFMRGEWQCDLSERHRAGCKEQTAEGPAGFEPICSADARTGRPGERLTEVASVESRESSDSLMSSSGGSLWVR